MGLRSLSKVEESRSRGKSTTQYTVKIMKVINTSLTECIRRLLQNRNEWRAMA